MRQLFWKVWMNIEFHKAQSSGLLTITSFFGFMLNWRGAQPSNMSNMETMIIWQPQKVQCLKSNEKYTHGGSLRRWSRWYYPLFKKITFCPRKSTIRVTTPKMQNLKKPKTGTERKNCPKWITPQWSAPQTTSVFQFLLWSVASIQCYDKKTAFGPLNYGRPVRKKIHNFTKLGKDLGFFLIVWKTRHPKQ